MRARLGVATTAMAAAALLSGCGGAKEVRGVEGKQIVALAETAMPPGVLGLTVAKEDVAGQIATGVNSYVDGVAIYSFRKDALLQATLQVSRFTDTARYKDLGFQRDLLLRIGSSSNPTTTRIGQKKVFLTQGGSQRLAVYFKDRYLFILATREDFGQPRTLLRSVLEYNP